MTSVHSEIRSLPLSALVLSQTRVQAERRAQFDKVALQALASTIKSTGRVEQAITVRPNINKDAFEIADGERRFLATQIAGLDEILAEVRELTDEQVEEIQIVTGLQKEKLHPLVEAEGYEMLMKRGLSVEEISAKVGGKGDHKSVATIYARMKLLALCEFVRDCFRRGEIEASIALIAARIPLPAAQVDFVKRALPGGRWNDSDAMTYREALDLYRREFTLDLKDAPFPTDDTKLVPKAGACGTCPKNTLSQPGLFADVSTKALCTDRPCFALKKAAYVQLQIDAAKAKGQRVFEGKEAKKIAPHGNYSMEDGYIRLDRSSHEVPGKTYKQLLGRAGKPDLVLVPETHELVEIAHKSQVMKAARESGLLKKTAKDAHTSSGGGSSKAEVAKREAERKIDVETKQRLLLAVRAKDGGKLTAEHLRHIVAHLVCDGSYDTKIVDDALGFEPRAFYTENLKPLQKVTEATLERAIIDLLYLAELEYEGTKPTNLVATTAKRLKIDEKKIRAEVAASIKAPAPPAKAPKKKARK